MFYLLQMMLMMLMMRYAVQTTEPPERAQHSMLQRSSRWSNSMDIQMPDLCCDVMQMMMMMQVMRPVLLDACHPSLA